MKFRRRLPELRAAINALVSDDSAADVLGLNAGNNPAAIDYAGGPILGPGLRRTASFAVVLHPGERDGLDAVGVAAIIDRAAPGVAERGKAKGGRFMAQFDRRDAPSSIPSEDWLRKALALIPNDGRIQREADKGAGYSWLRVGAACWWGGMAAPAASRPLDYATAFVEWSERWPDAKDGADLHGDALALLSSFGRNDMTAEQLAQAGSGGWRRAWSSWRGWSIRISMRIRIRLAGRCGCAPPPSCRPLTRWWTTIPTTCRRVTLTRPGGGASSSRARAARR